MSREQHADALLDGWGGPVFPAELAELDDELAAAGRRVAFGLSGGWLSSCAGQVRGFVEGTSGPRTSDGYQWFWGLHWALVSTRVMLLVPMRMDDEARDDSRSDRSPAVYTQGEVGADTVAWIVQWFTEVVQRSS